MGRFVELSAKVMGDQSGSFSNRTVWLNRDHVVSVRMAGRAEADGTIIRTVDGVEYEVSMDWRTVLGLLP